ncbi:MAG: transglutaminase domain-containing protein [Clostridiales bacterium]|nr:transglutaminase domain-containing protein [Clostridiales bacterium]
MPFQKERLKIAVDYYLPSDLSLLENFVASEKYKQFELEYRAFVYSKYLQIPESTRAYMLSLGFNANDKDIINKVAEFIQSSAVYNMKYDRNLDKEEDIAVSFLRDYGEGICQHYATAATMLYRALGIPARYTIGYVAPTKEGEWSEILSTQAHAWVEVYVDGIGWVQMEVTGGGFGIGGNGNGGNGGGGNGSEDEAPEKIVVVPHSKKASILQVFVLDTVGLGCDVKNWDYYAEKGYTYKVKLNGRQEGIGFSFVTVSQFEVFDENGNEVTDLEIVTEKGTLTINKAVIMITSASEEKEYDGTTLENPTFTVGGVLGENHQVFLDVTGSIKDTGSVQNTIDKDSFKVLNGDIDVTYMYSPEFIEGILTVIGRKITVVTAGAEKFYDGEALTNGYYEVVGELVEGHEIKVVVTGSQTEVGQSDNTAVITITCNGEDVSSVYSITINFGILTVKERKTIEIKPVNKVEEYTGNPIVADDIESVSGLDEILAQGYTYGELVFSGSQTEIGESVSQIVNIRIYNALDEDVTEEFNIIRHNGILRVTKKQIVIQVYAISKVYDGKPISYQEEDWFTLSCPADVNLTFKLRGSRTTAGTITEDEIKTQSTFIVTNGLGEDVTDNYYLKLVGKLLTVKARVVEITTVSATKEYDGTPLFAYEYWISKGSLVEGEELFVVMKSQLTEVGMQRNYIDEIKVKDSAGNDVTEYYKFNMIFGDLIVTEE